MKSDCKCECILWFLTRADTLESVPLKYWVEASVIFIFCWPLLSIIVCVKGDRWISAVGRKRVSGYCSKTDLFLVWRVRFGLNLLRFFLVRKLNYSPWVSWVIFYIKVGSTERNASLSTKDSVPRLLTTNLSRDSARRLAAISMPSTYLLSEARCVMLVWPSIRTAFPLLLLDGRELCLPTRRLCSLKVDCSEPSYWTDTPSSASFNF